MRVVAQEPGASGRPLDNGPDNRRRSGTARAASRPKRDVTVSRIPSVQPSTRYRVINVRTRGCNQAEPHCVRYIDMAIVAEPTPRNEQPSGSALDHRAADVHVRVARRGGDSRHLRDAHDPLWSAHLGTPFAMWIPPCKATATADGGDIQSTFQPHLQQASASTSRSPFSGGSGAGERVAPNRSPESEPRSRAPTKNARSADPSGTGDHLRRMHRGCWCGPDGLTSAPVVPTLQVGCAPQDRGPYRALHFLDRECRCGTRRDRRKMPYSKGRIRLGRPP